MIAGFLGGLSGAVSTAYGPPLLLFLQALKLQTHEFVAAIGAIWSFASIALVIAFYQNGVLVGERIYWSLAACIPVGIGMLLGSRIRNQIPQLMFRRIVNVALLVLALNLLRKAFF